MTEEKLNDRNKLKVFDRPDVTLVRENEYRMMPILDPLPDDDDPNMTPREQQPLNHINKYVNKKENKKEIERSTFDTIIVFSLLSMLWNASHSQCNIWNGMLCVAAMVQRR